MTPTLPARRPVAMIAHTYYAEDARVRREATALVAAGRPVDVFALRRPGEPEQSVLDGVVVHALDVQRHQGAGVGTYLREYIGFFARAAAAVTRAHGRRHYAVVQVHTLPDFLVGAALPLRVRGVPTILDMHEAMPEFFAVRFPRLASPVFHGLLVVQERLAIALAGRVVVANQALADRLRAARVGGSKVSVVPNSPSLALFDPSRHGARAFMADGVLRLVYTGALTPIYELDVAVEAVARLRDARPDLAVRLDVYGRGDAEAAWQAVAERLDVADRVTFHGRIPLEEVPAVIAAADIGLAPTRLDRYTKLSLSTKLYEIAAMERPAVATDLPLVRSTFGDTITVYPSGDAGALADAVLGLVDRPADRRELVRRARTRAQQLSWECFAPQYVGLVEAQAADGLSSTPDDRPDAMSAPAAGLEDA